MVDKISKERRSDNMRAIRSVSKLENEVTKRLWARRIRFRKNVKDMPGKPDIMIKKYKVVIFIDSCFWHGCPTHGTTPKSNTDFWTQKLMQNNERDRKVSEYYTKNGWNLSRIWEHEVRSDIEGTVDQIIVLIEKSKL